jgi:hypothetical protein
MHRLPAALLFVLLASPSAAQRLTAGALQGMCLAPAQAAACASYIQGYMDGRNQSLPRPTICLPAGTSLANVAAAYAAYLGNNRLEANIEAGLVLGNYLLSTYPCR